MPLPCITITSVVGGVSVKLTPTICQTVITITGTVAIPCTEIEVGVWCDPTMQSIGSVNTSGVLTGTAQAGSYISGTNWTIVLVALCCCDTPINVFARCKSHPGCATNQSLVLKCDQCCPTFGTPVVTYGDCNPQGNATVTFSIPVTVPISPECPNPTNIRLYFGDGQMQNFSVSGTGTITATHQYASGSHTAYLSMTLLEGCPKLEIPVNIDCKPPQHCPEFSQLNYSISACKYDGSVDITGSALVTLASGSGPITVQWHVDGVPIPPAIAVNTSGTVPLSFSMVGDGQTHTLTLQVQSATGCPPLSTTFSVPNCKSCPPVKFETQTLGCNEDGTRNAIVAAYLVAPNANTIITAQMSGPFGTVAGSSTGSLTLSSPVWPYNTGTYTVTVTVGNCPPQTYSYYIKDCCPDVQFEVRFCDSPFGGSNPCTRHARIRAVVTPQPGTSVQAELRDSATGGVLDNGYSTSAPTFELKGEYDYAPGTNPQVEVVFAAPLEKCKATTQFCVPDCQSQRCTWLHYLVIVTLSSALCMLSLVAISALATAVMTSSPPLWLAILFQNWISLGVVVNSGQFAGALAGFSAVAIGLLIWWWLCISIFGVTIGSCCGTRCVFRAMMWQVPLLIALLLICVIPACFILTILFAVIFFLLFVVFRKIWRKKCCVGQCDELYYMQLAAYALAPALFAVEAIAGIWQTYAGLPPLLYVFWTLIVLYVLLWFFGLVLSLSSCQKDCERW